MRLARTQRDLYDIIGDLERRIRTLETARGLGSATVQNGELAITNSDIVVRTTDGEKVLAIEGDASPRINFYPAGPGSEEYELRMYGWESESQGAALETTVRRVTDDVGGTVHSGGKLLLMRGGSYLAHQEEGKEESFISLGAYGPGVILFKGKFADDMSLGDTAVVCGSDLVVAGFGGYAYTYGTPPVSGTMVAVVQMVNTAGAIAGCLTAHSNTGWTFSWTGTLAKVVNYWCFRI